MLPWPLVRFGAAAELLGRSVKDSLPFTIAAGGELVRRTRVTLGADLESIGLGTEVDPASDPAMASRMWRAIADMSGPSAAGWWERRAPAGRAELTMTLLASGIGYTVERPIAPDAIATRAGSAAAALIDRLGPLAVTVDRSLDHWSELGARLRFGAPTTDPDVVAGLLARSRIPAPQRNYFGGTAKVWTLWEPQMTALVAVDGSGLVDEVGVVFERVPAEHLVRAWGTFRPRDDFAKRLGAFVAAMGVEIADRFELRFQRAHEPRLEATFTPADVAFQHAVATN